MCRIEVGFILNVQSGTVDAIWHIWTTFINMFLSTIGSTNRVWTKYCQMTELLTLVTSKYYGLGSYPVLSWSKVEATIVNDRLQNGSWCYEDPIVIAGGFRRSGTKWIKIIRINNFFLHWLYIY